jgi:hypothetical protein
VVGFLVIPLQLPALLGKHVGALLLVFVLVRVGGQHAAQDLSFVFGGVLLDLRVIETEVERVVDGSRVVRPGLQAVVGKVPPRLVGVHGRKILTRNKGFILFGGHVGCDHLDVPDVLAILVFLDVDGHAERQLITKLGEQLEALDVLAGIVEERELVPVGIVYFGVRAIGASLGRRGDADDWRGDAGRSGSVDSRRLDVFGLVVFGLKVFWLVVFGLRLRLGVWVDVPLPQNVQVLFVKAAVPIDVKLLVDALELLLEFLRSKRFLNFLVKRQRRVSVVETIIPNTILTIRILLLFLASRRSRSIRTNTSTSGTVIARAASTSGTIGSGLGVVNSGCAAGRKRAGRRRAGRRRWALKDGSHGRPSHGQGDGNGVGVHGCGEVGRVEVEVSCV